MDLSSMVSCWKSVPAFCAKEPGSVWGMLNFLDSSQVNSGLVKKAGFDTQETEGFRSISNSNASFLCSASLTSLLWRDFLEGQCVQCVALKRPKSLAYRKIVLVYSESSTLILFCCSLLHSLGVCNNLYIHNTLKGTHPSFPFTCNIPM